MSANRVRDFARAPKVGIYPGFALAMAVLSVTYSKLPFAKCLSEDATNVAGLKRETRTSITTTSSELAQGGLRAARSL